MSLGSPALPIHHVRLGVLAAAAAGMAAAAIHSALPGLRGGPAGDLERGLHRASMAPAPAVPPPALMADARVLLARQPLSPTPLLVAARTAEADGDTALATRLFEAALVRDPRDIAVRLWLADRYLRAARFADLVVQLDAVMRIRPALRRKLVSVIIPLVGAPEARQAIAEALVDNPVWQADFVDAAVREGQIARAFYRLVFDLGENRGFRLSDAQLTRIVKTALARGDVRSAWTIYSRYAPRSALATANQVFDAEFQGAAGPPPFNWELSNTASGSARIEPLNSRGRLRVQTFGAEPATLATQTLLLAPGDYILSSASAPDLAGSIEGLKWLLTCDRTRGELGSMKVDDGSMGGDSAGVPITVSALCPVATLQLVYAPTAQSTPGRAVLTRVGLERVGTGAG
ncbi:hypothetical protein GCM10007973_10350 [Polymorphobacter multimanifer]|uniref:Tetratricopeptide repeat protein n=1 Tax=Polymorphobacter multimanifer TaxID=1070431 RepID=A0A841L7H7_9SPHN|nr:hypothetical protein [Polymorphobacter multimanifer]MBB6228534.1 hypothetical protein [Polymorphobacter multimanifer]GGI75412.1 hypothetical protein GCM10007973_10350 [Polymorphobacter multimanifer]